MILGYHFAIDHHKALIKLLAGSLPAVMTPQPELRCTADIVFQHPEVDVSQFEVSQFLRFFCYELELCLIIASSHPMDIQIKYGVVHLLHDTLRSCQYGGVVIQKVHPVMGPSAL